jgi:hypothetical protein
MLCSLKRGRRIHSMSTEHDDATNSIQHRLHLGRLSARPTDQHPPHPRGHGRRDRVCQKSLARDLGERSTRPSWRSREGAREIGWPSWQGSRPRGSQELSSTRPSLVSRASIQSRRWTRRFIRQSRGRCRIGLKGCEFGAARLSDGTHNQSQS